MKIRFKIYQIIRLIIYTYICLVGAIEVAHINNYKAQCNFLIFSLSLSIIFISMYYGIRYKLNHNFFKNRSKIKYVVEVYILLLYPVGILSGITNFNLIIVLGVSVIVPYLDKIVIATYRRMIQE